MFEIGLDFSIVKLISGSQNEGARLFHFHFCQILLFPRSLRLPLENPAFELQKFTVTLPKQDEQKTNTKPTFSKILRPIWPVTLSSQIVQLYLIPLKTPHLGSDFATALSKVKTKRNWALACWVVTGSSFAKHFCFNHFLVRSLRSLTTQAILRSWTKDAWFPTLSFLCSPVTSRSFGQVEMCCGSGNTHAVWSFASP